MDVNNAVYPGAAQIAAFFGAPEDGPFVMVNLLKFKPKAQYADGSDAHLTAAPRPTAATAKLWPSWSRAWAARSAIPAR